jgi:hypothetical protein
MKNSLRVSMADWNRYKKKILVMLDRSTEIIQLEKQREKNEGN